MPLVIHLVHGGTIEPRFSQAEDTAFAQAFQHYLEGIPQINDSRPASGCKFHLVQDSASYMVINFAHVTHILETQAE